MRGILVGAGKDAKIHKRRILDHAQQAATVEKDRAVCKIYVAKDGALQELAEKSINVGVELAGQIVGKQLDR